MLIPKNNIYNKIRRLQTGGKITPRYETDNSYVYRVNSDRTRTLVPFLKPETYKRFSKSKYFMNTLEKAFNTYNTRVLQDHKLKIPTTGKTIKVKLGGNFSQSGVYNIPEQVFNLLVASAKRTRIDPRLALAIAIKESGGGTSKERAGYVYKSGLHNGKYMTYNTPGFIGPSQVVSNWAYFDNNPYIGLIRGWEKSNWDYKRVDEDAAYQYKMHGKEYLEYDLRVNSSENIFDHMFKIPLNKINPGLKDYVPIINLYTKNISW